MLFSKQIVVLIIGPWNKKYGQIEQYTACGLSWYNILYLKISKFLLTISRRCFFCGSFSLFVFHVCLSYCRVCSLLPCGHLLGKGWPLGSLICDVFLCFYHFPIWCSLSGVIFGINYWSLPSSLHWLGLESFVVGKGYTQQKKLRKLCLKAITKYLKHLKTFEFHNSIM